MSDNLHERIKKLIEAENTKKLQIAKAEQKLESLKEKQNELLAQLKDFNVDKENVEEKLKEMKEELESSVSYAEGILK